MTSLPVRYRIASDEAGDRPRLDPIRFHQSDTHAPEDSVETRNSRLSRLVQEQHDLVWRTVRRLGVQDKDIDDAVQRVFIVVGTKLAHIHSEQERSYVFGVAMRVASEVRRAQRRRPEQLVAEHFDGADESPGPDALLDQGKLLQLLGTMLKQLPDEQRAVFMLHEFEEMSLSEVARMLEIPVGTAASRLRRGRKAFSDLVARYRERHALEEL